MQLVNDDDPRRDSPFTKAKVWKATHRHRRNPEVHTMVTLRSSSWVRHDLGNDAWGFDPAEEFDSSWEPLGKPKANGIFGLFA